MSTSPRPYKNQHRKDMDSQDLFVKPKDMVKHEELEGERLDRMREWVTFFRRNPHRFIETYFDIKLYPYQILMIWVLQRSNLGYIVASRAAAKTFMIAIWALTLCVLYPGIKVVTCSKTMKQGGLIIGKIDELRRKFGNVAREISKLTNNPNEATILFQNGSTIKAVPSSESSRGQRANYIIIEESRLVSKHILDSVIKPFLEVRTPPYKLLPKYSGEASLREEGIISYITSAGYKAEYWYDTVKSCVKRMANGDETSNFLAFDYLITLFHNIKTETMIKNEMEDMDNLTIQMEYLNIPSGASGKSYFRPTFFPRRIKRAFYPQKDDTYNAKRNPYAIAKVDGELRFIGADIATRANKSNDNSVIVCVRAIPILGKGYERSLLYMESYKGKDVGVQAKRIKEIYHDFEADYIVLDMMNAGIGVFDSLTEPTIYEEKNLTIEGLGVVEEEFPFVAKSIIEDLTNNHTRSANPKPVIFPISATLDLNSQIASALRVSLQKKLWNFLINEADAEMFLLKNQKEFIANANDSSASSFFLNPYVQTGFFIGECINLSMNLVSGRVKLVEKSGGYKDRYTAVSYVNWTISYFDQELLKEQDEYDDNEILNLIQVY